jgi:hypothetical protein
MGRLPRQPGGQAREDLQVETDVQAGQGGEGVGDARSATRAAILALQSILHDMYRRLYWRHVDGPAAFPILGNVMEASAVPSARSQPRQPAVLARNSNICPPPPGLGER